MYLDYPTQSRKIGTVGNSSLTNKSNEGFNSKLHDLQKRFKTEYKRCGAKCIVKDISILTDGFYEEEFISECESMLQKCIESVKYSIRSDTNGFFKKVKAFLKNPFSKHKELAMTKLFEVIDQLSPKITDYTIRRVKNKLIQANSDAEKSIQNMINDDRSVVDEYINITNQSIDSNNKSKESTQACIKRLNEYIRLMKEVT